SPAPRRSSQAVALAAFRVGARNPGRSNRATPLLRVRDAREAMLRVGGPRSDPPRRRRGPTTGPPERSVGAGHLLVLVLVRTGPRDGADHDVGEESLAHGARTVRLTGTSGVGRDGGRTDGVGSH